MGQQRGLERGGREPVDGLIERVGWASLRDFNERHAERAGPIGDHLPGQRLVGEAACDWRGANAVVVRCVVGERAVRSVLRLPKIAQVDSLGVSQPLLANREAPCASAEKESLLHLGITAAELVCSYLMIAAHLERVIGREWKHTTRHDLWDRDVADVVRHGSALLDADRERPILDASSSGSDAIGHDVRLTHAAA